MPQVLERPERGYGQRPSRSNFAKLETLDGFHAAQCSDIAAAGLRDTAALRSRTATVLKASRSSFAKTTRVEDSDAPLRSGVAAAGLRDTAALRGRGLFWRMTQGSPAVRANPGLNNGISLGFLRQIWIGASSI
jgi:hypothetical protein